MKQQMLKPMFGGRVKQPVHYFKRFVDGGNIALVNGTTNTYGTVYFQLDAVPGYSEFTSLYDFYKILAVQVRFIPTQTQSTALAAGVSNAANRLFTVIDYNDYTTPTSLNDLRQYDNCKVTPLYRMHKRFFHPKCTIAVDEDGPATDQLNVAQLPGQVPWISTTSNSVDCTWFGIKYGIEHESPGATIYAYKVEIRVYMAFKGKF